MISDREWALQATADGRVLPMFANEETPRASAASGTYLLPDTSAAFLCHGASHFPDFPADIPHFFLFLAAAAASMAFTAALTARKAASCSDAEASAAATAWCTVRLTDPCSSPSGSQCCEKRAAPSVPALRAWAAAATAFWTSAAVPAVLPLGAVSADAVFCIHCGRPSAQRPAHCCPLCRLKMLQPCLLPSRHCPSYIWPDWNRYTPTPWGRSQENSPM
mmetsp:Transcript_2273/g.6799  ORF Transcript_2273/g.6799 Transcript_2273/m.6799 type:complete len:220 (+) Transcript_2273:439-1098(+)